MAHRVTAEPAEGLDDRVNSSGSRVWDVNMRGYRSGDQYCAVPTYPMYSSRHGQPQPAVHCPQLISALEP